MWGLKESLLSQHDAEGLHAEPIEGVEGAFLVPDALSEKECAALICLCDQVGFSSGETLVEVPTRIRNNQVTLLVPPPSMAEELSRRLRRFVPSEGTGQGKRCDPECGAAGGGRTRTRGILPPFLLTRREPRA